MIDCYPFLIHKLSEHLHYLVLNTKNNNFSFFALVVSLSQVGFQGWADFDTKGAIAVDEVQIYTGRCHHGKDFQFRFEFRY